jgi:hypothetical protein
MDEQLRSDPWGDPQFEQAVRETAYFLWEQDGRPQGREQEYWYRALERTLRERNAANGMRQHPADPEAARREPKGDHNRRLALGLDRDRFAAEAGVPAEDLKDYEESLPGDDFDLAIAQRVGLALDRLEAAPPASQKVQN